MSKSQKESTSALRKSRLPRFDSEYLSTWRATDVAKLEL